jgi:predicted amidophosphoribosyltransferase
VKRLFYGARKGRDWLESVERTWLGWTLPPTRRVFAETDWAPDDEGGYCGRCGDSVGTGEETDGGCGSCRGRPGVVDGVVRLGAYSGHLREWVRAIKYRGWAEMADALGRRLGAAVECRLTRQAALDREQTVVVPMPMPWQRRLYRGIDHAGLIAAGVSAELGVGPLVALAKANGPPQVSLSASRRAHAGAGMRLTRRAAGIRLDGVQVVLVDDVRTSGASLRAAGRLLRRRGPRQVTAAVLAVTDERSRRSPSDPGGPANG